MQLKNFAVGMVMILLTSCGGNLQLADGGIGGTGISTGAISAFGSIFVNGVEYNVDQAQFTRDGVAVGGQSDYRIGEYVTVNGKVNADGVTGTATEVVFDDDIEGSVTSPSTDGVSLVIMGQQVRADSLTVLHGFALLTDLQAGNIVEVSGVKDAQGVLTASSITLKQAHYIPSVSELELKGTVEQVNSLAQTFRLGGLTVDYATAVLRNLPAGLPVNGQYVEVKSEQNLQGSRLIASSVQGIEEYSTYKSGTKLEIEGLISRFASAADFTVNGQQVSTSAQTQYEDGSARDLSLNALVEVEGIIDAQGVLAAREISIKTSDTNRIIELEGSITAIDSAAQEFVLLGNTVTVNSSTLWLDDSAYASTQFMFDQLNVGDTIDLQAKQLSDGKLLALRIDREDVSDEYTVRGTVASADPVQGTLQVQGINILTDASTSFEGGDGDLTAARFFAALVPGETEVKVEGMLVGDTTLQARSIEIQD